MNAHTNCIIPASEDVSFSADVATLKGRVFRPAGVPNAAVVLHGATGVPARYYHAFAAWLAEQGYACLTYDYRDFGASGTGDLRASDASMVKWGLGDQPAAQAALERLFPGIPVWVIGHSIGAMMVPFHPGASRIKRLIAVAAGPVHTTDHPGRWRYLSRLFWWGPPAWATAALGYLPGRALRIGPDLPAGVYWQWRRWCTTKGFYLGDVGRCLPVPDWGAFTGPMRVVAISDDQMMPPKAVWRLMQHYPEAWKQQAVLRPVAGPIGHVAAFSERNRALWPEIVGPSG